MNPEDSKPRGSTGLEESISSLILSDDPDFLIFRPSLQKLHSNVPGLELEGIREIRIELSNEENPLIDQVIKTNIIPNLIQMSYTRSETFAFELTWIMCNIAFGGSSHIEYLLKHRFLEFFEKVFETHPNSFELLDQVVWALGNVTAESVYYRDLILNSPIFVKFIQYGNQIVNSSKTILHENFLWVLSNLSRFNPAPPQHILQELDFILSDYLPKHIKNHRALSDILWGLSFTSESLINLDHYPAKVVPWVVQSFEFSLESIITPSLKIIRNVLMKIENSYGLLLSLNILIVVSKCLGYPKLIIIKETIKIVSVLASMSKIVEQLLELGIFSKLYESIELNDPEIINEITLIVKNSFLTSETAQAQILVEMGWIEKLIEKSHTLDDERLTTVVFEAIKKVPEALKKLLIERFKKVSEKCLDDGQKMNRIHRVLQYFEVGESGNRFFDLEMQGYNIG